VNSEGWKLRWVIGKNKDTHKLEIPSPSGKIRVIDKPFSFYFNELAESCPSLLFASNEKIEIIIMNLRIPYSV